MRRLVASAAAATAAVIAALIAGLVGAPAALAQDDAGTERAGTDRDGPLVVVPAGCVAPPPAHAVFVGTLVAAVPDTARFRLDQVRAGSVDGFAIDGLVDVDYDDETRFLELGDTYLVGVAVEPSSQRLWSKVREPAPLFGGNDVVGVDDVDVQCPEVGDPIRTVNPDGSSVDTGVFTPLTRSTAKIVRAVVVPVVVAVAIVLGLVALKSALIGVGHGYGALARRALDRPATPRRRHDAG